MEWHLWKRSTIEGNSEPRREQGFFRRSQQGKVDEQNEENHLDLIDEDSTDLKEGDHIDQKKEEDLQCKEGEVHQDQDKEEEEEEVKFLRMRWVPVKRRRRLDCAQCFCCCCSRPSEEDGDEDEEEYLRRLTRIWNHRKIGSNCNLFSENKKAESNKENSGGDHSRSQEYKRDVICSLASYVKDAALTLHEKKAQLSSVHHELQNIEDVGQQLVDFILEDNGSHWRDYECLFLLFMVMVKPLFHRVLAHEECPIMIKVIEKLREYVGEIMLDARRIIGFLSYEEHETLEYFMKTSKEWVCHFEDNDELSVTDVSYLPGGEDLHLKYNYLTRRHQKNRAGDVKVKILGGNKDERNHNNIEGGHISDDSKVKVAEHPFKDLISYFMMPGHCRNPNCPLRVSYEELIAYDEMPQKLYMLQTMMIYIVDTQKKVQIEGDWLLQLRDELQIIEDILIKVMDFICDDQGASTTQVYEDKLLEIKKVTQPMFHHEVQEEWPKMMRMMKIIKSLCYKLVFRAESCHVLNIFSEDMIETVKLFVEDVSDWTQDLDDKIKAFETCERIEESLRWNNSFPDHEALYLIINRKIQKLKDKDNDDLKDWMDHLYYYNRNLCWPIIDEVSSDNALSSDGTHSDGESSCDGLVSWWRLMEACVDTELCQSTGSASVDSKTIDGIIEETSCCYSHPGSISDQLVLVPSMTVLGEKDEPKEHCKKTGDVKENAGQADTYITEKVEVKPVEDTSRNIVLEVIKTEESHIPLDVQVIMWLCALFYFWKHLSGLQ